MKYWRNIFMFVDNDSWDVEEICYDHTHIQNVVSEIKKNFDTYFEKYIQTEAGNGISQEDFEKMKRKMGICSDEKRQKKDWSQNYKRIIREAIDDFEKDRNAYIELFDEEALEEAEYDPSSFKSKTLKYECPIIKNTLFSNAKELGKYKRQYSISDPNELLQVVQTLSQFGEKYQNDVYDPKTYEDAKQYEDLRLENMDTEAFTVYGVIGGGIKSHMMYKVYPNTFPNRSRNAIWALWYLTDKKTFGCKTDSEFLMIDVGKSFTQQNYFYPYKLFAFYAFEIYKLLRDKATELGAYIDTDYRYVIVDSFLSFVENVHDEETSFLKAQIRDGGRGFA
mgnify:FL=1